jgi:hypothetical protein
MSKKNNKVEKAYRKGVAQALNMAYDHKELRTPEACDLVMEMRCDFDRYPDFSLDMLIAEVSEIFAQGAIVEG